MGASGSVLGAESAGAGGMRVEAGGVGDYWALAGYHYRKARPVAMTQIWVVRDGAAGGGPAGVLVVARPPLSCRLRSLATGGRYELADRGLAAALVNRDFRTIARVIVRPGAEGRGVATRLVRRALACAETVFTEAIAVKARTHPFFERAGMTRFDRPREESGVRLMAALEYAEIAVGELGCREVWEGKLGRLDGPTRGFLWAELRRWAGPKAAGILGSGEAGDGGWGALLEAARERLEGRAVYLIAERGNGV